VVFGKGLSAQGGACCGEDADDEAGEEAGRGLVFMRLVCGVGVGVGVYSGEKGLSMQDWGERVDVCEPVV
jgi:hypothetical protein